LIVDTHTHLFSGALEITDSEPDAGGKSGMTARAFAERLNALGVSKALVFTLDGLYGNCHHYNDELYHLSQELPDVLYPFCTVNPRDGREAVAELRRCMEDLGMLGIKFHPWLQAFPPVHEGMTAIVEEAVGLGAPMIFHDGTPPYSAPLQIAYLAERFPEGAFILGHTGLHDMWIEALRAAERYPNIYLCTAGATLQAVRQAIAQVGAERVMFGTDFPVLADAGVKLHRQIVVEATESEEAQEWLFSGTILRLLPHLSD